MARPTRFSRDDILEKATQAFWHEGYHATGMAELGNVTDLNPGSLYAAFDSKRELFLASLDYYGKRSVARLEKALVTQASPLSALRNFFQKLARETAGDKGRDSCFLVNSVMEVARHDAEVQDRINVHFRQIEGLLRHCLKQAQACGELRADKDPNALAAFLLNNIWGFRVLGGTAPSAKRTRDIVRLVLSVLD